MTGKIINFAIPKHCSDRQKRLYAPYLPFVRWWKWKHPHGYYNDRGHLNKGLFYSSTL